MQTFTRRSLLQYSGLAAAANLAPMVLAEAANSRTTTIHVNLNENAFGPSPLVGPAITRELSRISRYATETQAQAFTQQIAEYEKVSPDQIVLGEILGGLGLYLGSQGGPGGEFLYSTPGYTALIDAASHVGGVGVPVPLNKQFENDLSAFRSKITSRTRAIYLINPHNPTGTVNEASALRSFVKEASSRAPIIIDEAYLEYTEDFDVRSGVSLVREGLNVLVFRTFDKIHGLAGIPIGYTLAPAKLAKELKANGLGDAEGLGRLNIAAASAALSDREHSRRVRSNISHERDAWLKLLREIKLPHTDTKTNFVFFDAGAHRSQLIQKFKESHIEVARVFPPYETWIRITIGLPEENQRIQRIVRESFVG